MHAPRNVATPLKLSKQTLHLVGVHFPRNDWLRLICRLHLCGVVQVLKRNGVVQSEMEALHLQASHPQLEALLSAVIGIVAAVVAQL